MNSPDTARLASDILSFLVERKVSGEERLAALKTAAATLEAIQDLEIRQQFLRASLQKVLA